MKVKENSYDNVHSSDQRALENTKFQTLSPIYQLGTQFLEAANEKEVYARLLDVIESKFEGCTVSIMVLQENADILHTIASRGLTSDQIEGSQIRPGEGIARWVFANNRPLILNRSTRHQSEFVHLLTRQEIASAICFPMENREGVIGVINISQEDEDITYSAADIELVSILSQLTAMATDNVRLNEQRLEAARVKTLLEQYVSADVAGLLMEQQQDLHEIGDIQYLTVMFADLRNFTQLVQKLDLQKLRLFLNDFFALLTDEVYLSRGTLNKFIGDGVLVIFGAPISHSRPGHAAMETAKKIIGRFRKLCEHYCRENDCFNETALGIGIAAGEMFIGNVGSEKRFDYTVVGTAVNVAYRLASHASGDTIIITDELRQTVAATIDIEKSELITLRGFQDSILVHIVDHRNMHD